MEFFTERSGRYVYNSSESGSSARLFKIIILSSMVFSIGILALVYYLMKYRAESSVAGIFPIVAAIFVTTDLMMFIFLRKKLGLGGSDSLRIDNMQGIISCKSTSHFFSKRMEIRTGEINDLALVKKEAPSYGFGNSAETFAIRISTINGIFDILSFTDRERARGVANELASVVSRSLKDMT